MKNSMDVPEIPRSGKIQKSKIRCQDVLFPISIWTPLLFVYHNNLYVKNKLIHRIKRQRQIIIWTLPYRGIAKKKTIWFIAIKLSLNLWENKVFQLYNSKNN